MPPTPHLCTRGRSASPGSTAGRSSHRATDSRWTGPGRGGARSRRHAPKAGRPRRWRVPRRSRRPGPGRRARGSECGPKAAVPAGESPAGAISQCGAVVIPDARKRRLIGRKLRRKSPGGRGQPQVESVQGASNPVGCVMEPREEPTQSRGWHNGGAEPVPIGRRLSPAGKSWESAPAGPSGVREHCTLERNSGERGKGSGPANTHPYGKAHRITAEREVGEWRPSLAAEVVGAMMGEQQQAPGAKDLWVEGGPRGGGPRRRMGVDPQRHTGDRGSRRFPVSGSP
jgi:hypothetical protein